MNAPNRSGITVTKSILYKRKVAKYGYAFFIIKYKDIYGGECELVEEVRTKGLSDMAELAVKGALVKKFREHFKI